MIALRGSIRTGERPECARCVCSSYRDPANCGEIAAAMSSTVQQTLQAYERWAPIYPPVAHNPLMRAEQQAMLERLPALAGRRVLDLACGSGRYSRLLLEAHAGRVVALDFCIPMLRQSTRRAASAPA